MPIYEYRCKSCDHIFEAFQRVGDNGSDLHCPSCNAEKPDKIFSTFASAGAENSGIADISTGCGTGGFT